MGQIGTLGNIVFEASTEKIQTFKDMKRKGAARVATHEIIGQKPVSEFIGSNLDEISFSMQLKTNLGVDISKVLEELREIRDTGKIVNLIIAGEPVSENKWLVLSIDESINATDGEGNTISAEVSVNLREYVEQQQEGQ